MPGSAVVDVPALISETREWYGGDLVTGRTTAEGKARALLDGSAGSMTHDQAMYLGELLNEHVAKGVVRHDRFSPAFVGGSLNKLTEDLSTFNDRVARIWRGDEEAALAALDESLKNRQLFPGAGSPSRRFYVLA